MANMQRLGNTVKGRNRDGWRAEREQAREQFRALIYIIGRAPAFSLLILLILFTGCLLPG